LTALLFAVTLFAARERPQMARADGVQNYAGYLTVDAGTAHTADWSGTAWSVEGYGSVYIQVTQDLTSAVDSVVYTLYRSIDPVACTAVTHWSPAYERVNVENPAVAASRYISYTRTTTTTPPYNITYNYATVAAVNASVTTVVITQTATVMGDKTYGLEFDTDGARCMRIAADITTGRTVTTTIYVAPVDLYE
jgi:hypothetical protein